MSRIVQRRKCGDKCVLALFFPPNDPRKFLVVHKLFGSSNIAKIIQDIPAEKRADAVTSLVYEASMRANDAVTSHVSIAEANITHASLVAGFCNSGETGTTLDPYRDKVIILQDDEDPFGLWAPL